MNRFAIFIALVGTGCTPAYLHSASRFADEGREQLRSLAPAESLSSDLCLARARLDLVNHRLSDRDHGWGSAPSWSAWMEKHPDDAGKTWSQRCAQQKAGDAVLHQGTGLLAAYLAQMKGVAEGELPLGVSPTLVAKGISKAVEQLHAGMVSETAAAMEGPLTDAVDLMLKQYNAHELQPFLAQGDPVFQKLITALTNYVDSIDTERAEVERMEGVVLDELEQPLAKPSDQEPARTVMFLEFAARVDEKLRANARAVQAYRDTLASLSSTHHRLTRQALGLQPDGEQPPPRPEQMPGLMPANQTPGDSAR